jgi:hypothetical protein
MKAILIDCKKVDTLSFISILASNFLAIHNTYPTNAIASTINKVHLKSEDENNNNLTL